MGGGLPSVHRGGVACVDYLHRHVSHGRVSHRASLLAFERTWLCFVEACPQVVDSRHLVVRCLCCSLCEYNHHLHRDSDTGAMIHCQRTEPLFLNRKPQPYHCRLAVCVGRVSSPFTDENTLISVARARGYRQISVAYARDTAATDICRYPGHMPRISADIPWEVPEP